MAKLLSGTRIYGNLIVDTFVTATGNVISGNVTTVGVVTATGNITGGNVLTGGQVSATGNITTAGFFVGTFAGSISGNVTAPGANTQVIYNNSGNLAASAGFTFNQAGNILTANGNISGANFLTAGLISATSTITGGQFIGNGNTISNIQGANVSGNVTSAVTAGTVTTNAQPNITSVGTLTSITSSGLVSTTGNLVGANILTAGLISSTGNIISAANITGANITTAGLITATGNIQGGNIVTAGLFSATGNITGNNLSATLITGTLTTNAQPNITSVGTLTSLSVTGNTTSGNFTTGGTLSVGGIVMSGNTIVGAGPTLTIDPNGLGGTDGNVVITGNLTVQGTTTTINSNTVTTNDLQINMANNAANATAANNGGIGVGPIGAEYATLLYNTASNVWVSSLGISAVGSITTGAGITATGNVYGGNVTTAGIVSATANITGGNLLTAGQVSATGNITTAGFFVGTFAGSISGNVTAPGSNTQVIYNNNGNLAGSTGFTFDQSSNALVVTGNITGANIRTAGIISGTGNVIGGNITTVGLITATGSITGGNILFGSGIVSGTGNISVGTFTGATATRKGLLLNQDTTIGLQVYGNYTAAQMRITNPTIADWDHIIDSAGVYSISGVGSLKVPSGVSTANTTSGALVVTGGIGLTGNIYSGGLISATSTVTAGQFVGNGNTISNIQGANVSGNVTSAITAGTVTTNVQPNITSVGTLTSVTSSGLVSTTGNLVGANILTAGLISATSTITSAANITGGNVLTAGLMSSTGNATAGNVLTAGLVSATGNATAGNVLTSGQVSATGNITTAAFFVGTFAGSISGNVTAPGANTQVVYNNSGNLAGSTGFTFNQASNALVITGNITGANFLTAGLISATGTITSGSNLLFTGTAARIIGDFSNATVASRTMFQTNAANSLTRISAIPTGTGTQTLFTAYNNSDPTNAGTLSIIAQSTIHAITASVTGTGTQLPLAFTIGSTEAMRIDTNGNILIVGLLSAGGNVTGGNVTTAGLISATGNVTGNYILGNGALLTGVITSVANINNGNSNVTVVSAGGNITVGVGGTGNVVVFATTGEYVTGVVSASGNVTGANVLTAGLVSATGNVTGNYILGNGALLTGITTSGGNSISNGTSNVTVVSSGGNITVGVSGVGNVVVWAPTGEYVTGNISASGNIVGGGVRSTSSGTPPSTPSVGDFWYNTTTNVQYRFTFDGTNYYWIDDFGTTTGVINIATLTSIANGISNVNAVTANGNVTVGVNGTNNVVVIASTGEYVTGVVSASGNVTGNYILGNGALLTGVITSVANINNGTSNVTVVSSGGNVTVGVAGTANVAVFASTGEYVTGVVSASGNVTGANILTGGQISATGNITTAGFFLGTFAGNISGNLTVPGSNTQVIYNNSGNAGASAGFTFNAATNAMVVTGNVTGGNILTAGLISSTGNATFANLFINNDTVMTGNLTVNGNVTYINSNTITTNDKNIILANNQNTAANVDGGGIDLGNNSVVTWRFNNATTSWQSNVAITPAANISLNLGTSALWWNNFYAVNVNSSAMAATGNISGGNLTTAGLMSSTGNAIHGNVLTGGLISATGNITGGNLTIGAGQITLTSAGAGNISVGGNVIAGGYSGGAISSYGNVTGANFLTAGLISATGNITTSGFFVGTFAGSISGNVTAPGANTQVVYNNSGNLAGSTGFTFNQASNAMIVSGNVTGANILTAGLISATSTITSAANIVGINHLGTTVSASGNIYGGGILASTTAIAPSTISGAAIGSISDTTSGFSAPGIGFGSGTGSHGAIVYGGNLMYFGSENGIASGTMTTRMTLSKDGLLSVTGNVVAPYFVGTATTAQYADLAEMYVSDKDYSPGTVVDFGGTEEITVTTITHSTHTAGIVSTKPAYLMNSTQIGTHVLPVALTGRVPCQVVGNIRKGDCLVSSTITGVATVLDLAKHRPGCIIGKALENYNSNEVGIIEVAVGRF